MTLLFLYSCKKDDGQKHIESDSTPIAIKQWFEKEEYKLQDKGNWLNSLSPNWQVTNLINSIDSVKVYEIDLLNPRDIFALTQSTTIPVKTEDLSKNTNFRLVVFDVNGRLNGCIMELISFENNASLKDVHYKAYKNLNGAVNFYELDGTFNNGWIIENGKIIRQAIKKDSNGFNLIGSTQKSVGNGKIMLVDVNTVTCGRALVPHVRTVCVGSGGIEGWGYDGSGGSMNCRQETYYVSEVQYCEIPDGVDPDGGYTGGGGGSTSSGNNGNNTTDPDCVKVKAQSSSTAYKEKVEELKTKTNQKNETGFEEKKNGSFNPLTNDGDNSMNAVPLGDTKGFMHTHVNPYFTGKYDNNNDPIYNRPIRMFSPADVNILMGVVNKNRTTGNYLEYYVSMISSNGNYMIKFTGAESDLKMGFHTQEWDDSYKEFMMGYINLEKGFLRFLNEKMGVKGVKLYKVENNGNVKTIELKPDGKTIDKKDC
ncbi:MAG: hypothetical protein EOO47_22680 [Flavobacterium sp.]|nr:MAG: hypothetical protein EOO47_22680 [Flavobacterium sp.]